MTGAQSSWKSFVEAKSEEARPTPKQLAELRVAALQRLGGTGETWQDRLAQIDQWWTQMKKDEQNVTWESAFQANRMTIRGINITRTARYGRFEIGEQANAETNKKYAFLSRDPESIAERLNPDNFQHQPGKKSKKDILGLHALSASLLHGDYSINEQTKGYSDSIVLFFPAPSPEDMQIFDAISHLPGAPPDRLIDMRAKMTRLEGAWHGDMHTTMTYTNGQPRADKKVVSKVSHLYQEITDEKLDRAISVRYGLAGTWKDETGALYKATEKELAERYLYALQHPMILNNPSETVNEVVMSYRQHDSPVFPLYARFDNEKFLICKVTPTAQYRKVISELRRAWQSEGKGATDQKPNPSHTWEATGDHITAHGEYVKAK
ncbi:hypothetical protein ACFQ05_21880 [Amycolatopsis umgeniensis]|uniref:Uncharacterized protein n=1 Tax=Amycolatopsis umgeniensis TaxID=336628 RepID=A0A841BIB0_9PSEU|nr:hypothetical protein [Amycolatopsis umgeniensis]MBB5858272.1 hypothetical protein [Amycolatopsis umgeniensis]